MRGDECPCNHCKEYLGWIPILRKDGVWVDRPWCGAHNDICNPYKHGCLKKKNDRGQGPVFHWRALHLESGRPARSEGRCETFLSRGRDARSPRTPALPVGGSHGGMLPLGLSPLMIQSRDAATGPWPAVIFSPRSARVGSAADISCTHPFSNPKSAAASATSPYSSSVTVRLNGGVSFAR